MSYQSLARTWRPKRFSELVGQQHVVKALTHALENQRLHQALLFSGTRGVGKTTLGRILAKCLNCEHGVGPDPCTENPCANCREIDEGRFLDLIEVDAASRTGVDDTRELLDNVQYAPTRGRTKVYLIDEVHMLSRHAFNALLKTLEEPPQHVQFLLATTDPQKLPITILSRCLQFPLKRLPAGEIAGQLVHVLKAEGIEAEEQAIQEVALAADGSMRDALSLLDQAIAFGGGRLNAQEIHDMLGTVGRGQLVPVIEAVAAGDGAGLMRALDQLDQLAPDYAQLLEQLAAGLHCLSVLQLVPDAQPNDADLWRPLAEQLAPADVQIYYDIAVAARRDLDWAPDPRTGVEMACLRMLAFAPPGADDPAAGPGRSDSGMARPGAAAKSEATSDLPAASSVQTRAPVPAAEQNASARPGSAEPRPEPIQSPPAPPAGTDAPAAGPSPAEPLPLSCENWVDIAQDLPLTGVAAELARNSICRTADAQSLHLQLPESMEFMATANARQQLGDSISDRYGASVALKLTFGKAEAGESAAARSQRQEADRNAQARRAIEDDPMVRQMQEQLGASLIEDSIKPEQQR
ncbi:MAG: DNA polymerase III subunit gamma/tau [Salinisphaeraceae bacterium]|nr:DNA polymerase III subunit gamma/tau [Salinisphaeraceae bacterium]